ncbi:glycine oxidase ThiO [Asanoa ishikariensis]|uniref:glycine oxidase n=1 Tax=Asanoa ishikariensis TaxID=137265 RepID=A0A1H3UI07_9ACTN|nr:glycine oxidase ThiO [Asanoa ishikariensis]GIF63455.1 glycine oxidase ThiO [Asanoa ishikariensis]SDZ62122.1 glycine oxidase [Asanoa ishikariensis]
MTVLVAGGGLIGLAVAWRAAQRGLDVTVVDEAPGSGASLAAAGMLAPLTEAAYGEEALRALSRESLARYPAFLADLGGDVDLRTAGTLEVGFDADDMAALDRLHAYYLESGLPVERLTGSQARRREPALSPRVRGALHAPSDHSVEPRSLHAALLAAAVDAGVHIDRSRIAALTVDGGRAIGLRLADGTELTADTVVLALGAWSGSLPGAPPLPVRPVKGQILRLRGDTLLDGTIRALVRGQHVYLVPHGTDGGLVVGATSEELGFDPTVTAGAVHILLRDAIEVVPDVAELELVETLARWRPGTPDNAPLLGPSSLPGLVLATGHHRNGVLLTPATADAIAELLTEGALPSFAAPFAPDGRIG